MSLSWVSVAFLFWASRRRSTSALSRLAFSWTQAAERSARCSASLRAIAIGRGGLGERLRAVASSDCRATKPTTRVTTSATAGPIIQPATRPMPIARARKSTTQRKMKKSSFTIGRILSLDAAS